MLNVPCNSQIMPTTELVGDPLLSHTVQETSRRPEGAESGVGWREVV